MAAQEGRPARPLLGPTRAAALRNAVERLRGNGLSNAEAAAEIVRRSFYDFIDDETEAKSGKCPRLRIIKR